MRDNLLLSRFHRLELSQSVFLFESVRSTLTDVCPFRILGDVASAGSDVVGDIESLGTKIQGAITSAVAEGTDFFTALPDADGVKSSLGLDDDQVRALPTQALNLG